MIKYIVQYRLLWCACGDDKCRDPRAKLAARLTEEHNAVVLRIDVIQEPTVLVIHDDEHSAVPEGVRLTEQCMGYRRDKCLSILEIGGRRVVVAGRPVAKGRIDESDARQSASAYDRLQAVHDV